MKYYLPTLPTYCLDKYECNEYNSLPESFPTNSVNDEVDCAVENNHVVAEDVVIPLEIRA